ncbi:MAG: hypothetical protein HRU14_11085 [Planctomycetes bacterium]|nr:hypothetical protein [Planctomycetota bacterium]
MAQYRRSEIVSGTFILLALIVFAFFAFGAGGGDLFGLLSEESKTFVAVMPDIQALEVGAKVAVGGQRVGRVTKIEYASGDKLGSFQSRYGDAWGVSYGDVLREYESEQKSPLYPADRPPRVLVYFEVDRDTVEEDGVAEGAGRFMLVGPSSFALLMQEGFLGPYYIQLLQGPARTGTDAEHVFSLSEGEDNESAIPILGMSTDLLAGLATQVESLAAKLDQQLLSAKNLENIEGLLANANQLVVELRALVRDRVDPLLDPRLPGSIQQQLMQPAGALLRNSNEFVVDLRGDIKRVLTTHVEDLVREIQGLIANANGVLDTVHTTVKEITPQVSNTIANLEKGTKGLDQRLNTLQAQLSEVLAQADKLLKEGNGFIVEMKPDFLESLSSLRRTMWEAEVMMRKVRTNPAVLLWGDDEKLLSAWPTDPSDKRRAGRAPPYSQRNENDK